MTPSEGNNENLEVLEQRVVAARETAMSSTHDPFVIQRICTEHYAQGVDDFYNALYGDRK